MSNIHTTGWCGIVPRDIYRAGIPYPLTLLRVAAPRSRVELSCAAVGARRAPQ